MENTSKRLDYIDGLRGLAALMVIVVHSANFIGPGVLPGTILNWLKLGRFGVQIFYIISAFTIMMSVDKLKNTGGGYRTFYLRRFFRIAPLWWIAVAVTYAYNQCAGIKQGGLVSIIFHITALHGIFPQYIADIIVQGWSISIEVLFYILVPFIIKFAGERLDNYIRLIFWISIIVWPVNIVGDKLLVAYLPEADGAFCYLWFPNQMVAFLIGICLYLIIMKGKTVENWKSSSFYLIGISGVLFLSLSTVLLNSLIEAMIIFTLSKYGCKIINNKIFRYVGKVSYGVYLFHMLVICFLQDLRFMNHGSFVSLMIYFVVVPILSIGIGTITYYCIERPFLKLEKKIEKSI